MSDSTKRDIRKVKSACLLALLLLPGIIVALPAVSLLGVSAATGSPLTVYGATATIDDPIYASIGGATADTRVITVSNPVGNPGITTINIIVPTGASPATTPSGSIPSFGGVPDCSGGCPAKPFGSTPGPYTVEFCDTSGASTCGSTVILPAGASIQIELTITPETSTSTTGAADTFLYTPYVVDTTGASTQLSTITIYETTSSGPTISTQPPATETAGTPFTFTVSASGLQTGLSLNVLSRYSTFHKASAITISPTTFTTSSSATTVTVNDTNAADTALEVSVGIEYNSHSSGGLFANATTTAVDIVAGPSSSLGISVNGLTRTSSHYQINETSDGLILGGSIIVSSTDKYGNPVTQTAALAVTLTASTITGRSAGFTEAATTAYGAGTSPVTYPYTPSDLSLTTSCTIAISASTCSPTTNYYFGPDYGSTSQITASGTGLTSAVSDNIVTWSFNTGAPIMFPSTPKNLAAGSTSAVTAQTGGATNSGVGIAQGGITVYFKFNSNTTDNRGSFAGANTAVATTAVNSSGYAVATVTLTGSTLAGEVVTLSANYLTTPTANSTSSGVTAAITTVAGSFAKITMATYFVSSEALGTSTTKIANGGTLYIDACLTDAYGNSLTVSSGIVQLNLVASSGSLSSGTSFVTGGESCITASGYQVSYVAPSTVGTVVSITSSGTYGGLTATGSTSVTVVTKTPSMSFVSAPTAVTTGLPQTVTGWANASSGIYQDVITTLQYSLDGEGNVSIAAGAATNMFTITVVFPNASNYITVYATDSKGTVNSETVTVPTISTSSSISFPSFPLQTTVGTFTAISVTLTNNQPFALSAVILASVTNSVAQNGFSAGSTAGIFSTSAVGTEQVPADTTVTLTIIVFGLANGEYTGTVFALTTAGVPISSTTTLPLTIT